MAGVTQNLRDCPPGDYTTLLTAGIGGGMGQIKNTATAPEDIILLGGKGNWFPDGYPLGPGESMHIPHLSAEEALRAHPAAGAGTITVGVIGWEF